MATLVTVHGTFASGAEEGDAWWQRGAPFDKRLRELVVAPDGAFDHIPFVWLGLNTETARRAAASALLAKLNTLEAQGRDYAIVGHSHGGSVIASALYAAASTGNLLPHLKLWMTVGTPFISYIRKRTLFARLSNIGKAGYMVVVYLLFTLLSFLGYTYIAEGDASFGDIFFLLPFVVLYIMLRWMQVTDKRLYSSKLRKRTREAFEPRWLGLRHEDDEAIQGLGSLRDKRVDLFPPNFAVSTLTFVSLFALPALLYLVTRSPAAMQAIIDFAKALDDRTDLAYFQADDLGTPSFVKNGFLLLVLPAFVSLSYFERMGIPFSLAEPLSIATTLLVMVGVCWVLSLGVLWVVTVVARVISAAISHELNRASWAQIKRSAFGGDAVGETAMEVLPRPFWAEKLARCLPAGISQSLASYSNQYAAQAVAKFRDTLNRVAFQEGVGDSIGTFTGYLTWRELIHTSYFSIPEFQTLTACALVRAGPFEPTDRLKTEAMHDEIVLWLNNDTVPENDLKR